MKDLLFSDKEDAQKVVDKVRFSWIRCVLEQTGMDLGNSFSEGEDDLDSMTIAQKAELRHILDKNKILVLDDHDGGIRLYIDEDLIAEWKKPSFDLRHDNRQLNPKKKYYVGITIEYWSVFDEEMEKDNGER